MEVTFLTNRDEERIVADKLLFTEQSLTEEQQSQVRTNIGAIGAGELSSTLPNPHKLTLTGAVNAEYDGSEAVEVEIPFGGNGSEKEWELYDAIEISEDVADFAIGHPTNSENDFYKKQYTEILIVASIKGHAESTAAAALQIETNTWSGGYEQKFQNFIPKFGSASYFNVHVKIHANGQVRIEVGQTGTYAENGIAKWQKVNEAMQLFQTIRYFRIVNAKIGAGSTFAVYGR